MEAVKNGFHVQLGVSLSRNIKSALLQAGAAKEKPFLPVALLLELRCLFLELYAIWDTDKHRGDAEKMQMGFNITPKR